MSDNYNILIVDDKEDNLELLEMLIEENIENANVFQAISGKLALQMVAENKIDLILLDLVMPGMDGYEVAELLKQNENTKDIPIVFLTAHLKKESQKKKGYAIGAVDYLVKPIDDNQLLNKILLYLKIFDKEKELASKNSELKKINTNMKKIIDSEIQKNLEKDRMMELQSRHAQMGEMISAIVHQWKQPLNMLTVFLQDVADESIHGKIDKKFLHDSSTICLDQIGFLLETMDSFRSFFKVHREEEVFNIRKELSTLLELFGSSYNGINIEISGDESITTKGYQNEYAQVVTNILNNARDAFVDNGIKNRNIKIFLEKENDSAIVRISNNAGNIPEETLDEIFKPYFTTKDSDKGTGIGLYLSRAIIKKVGGTLKGQNTEDGMEFIICTKI